jgi:hypothetical protein
MFRKDLFDKRLKDNPYIYLLGVITFAGLALYCVYQIISGMMTGAILEIDCRTYRCLPLPPMKGHYDRFSDAPLGYLFYLGGWLLGLIVFSGIGGLCVGFIQNAGGLSPSLEVRALRIVARQRRSLDGELFHRLRQITPRNWKAARLEMEGETGFGSDRPTLTIVSPEGYPDLVGPTEEMYEAATKLHILLKRHGLEFRKTNYLVTTDERGNWLTRLDMAD